MSLKSEFSSWIVKEDMPRNRQKIFFQLRSGTAEGYVSQVGNDFVRITPEPLQGKGTIIPFTAIEFAQPAD